MFNRLGLCISYDNFKRVDIAITQEIINLAGSNRVPVPKNINSSSIIHGAMDNFDHEENTLSGIGGSHDTTLLLFQKPGMKDITENHKVIMRLTTQYFSNKIGEIENVPLFSAMSSFLYETSATKTKIAFTSILPYVATEYDTIHTVMCNFQNIFLQNSESYGPLWYDEGVLVGKRTPVFGPCKLWQHISGYRGF